MALLPVSHRTEPLPAPLDPHVEGMVVQGRKRPRRGRPRANQADRDQPGARLHRLRGGLDSIDIEHRAGAPGPDSRTWDSTPANSPRIYDCFCSLTLTQNSPVTLRLISSICAYWE